jgi:hypothetical protein
MSNDKNVHVLIVPYDDYYNDCNGGDWQIRDSNRPALIAAFRQVSSDHYQTYLFIFNESLAITTYTRDLNMYQFHKLLYIY